MAVESVVGKGNEWRAIAAESEVGGAEVGNGSDAGTRGDDGAFADLESGSGWRAEVRGWRALMKNCLAVVADEIDFARCDAEFFAGGKGGVGVDVAEAGVELAEFAGSDGRLFSDAEDFLADGGGEGDGGVVEEFDLKIRRRAPCRG